MSRTNSLLLAGPSLALLTALALHGTLGFAAAVTAAVTLWCVLWWVTEPVPVPVTSLLPLSLLPFFGVLDSTQVAQAYGSPLILLMLGGFMLSKGMESTGTHRRLALYMVRACSRLAGGQSDRSIVVGFMLASASLSMWISNTATTLMLLPIALAVIERNDREGFAIALMLGIAYAANVGGMGTPIGTPPNLIFMEVYAEITGARLSFLQWMQYAVPVVIVLVPIIAWWLTRKLHGGSAGSAQLLPEVGQWRSAEKRVLIVFGLTALAWITRSDPFGGWSSWLSLPSANDAAIALLAAVALFVTPNGEGGKLLNWKQASDIPWGILLLFAGGICLARAFTSSGLSEHLGQGLATLTYLPMWWLLLLLCLGVSFMTESTSNMATTALLMPLLGAAALAGKMDPILLMLPATLSASCAFMLPVATAPNAVVYGSGRVPAQAMLRNGLALNLIGALVIASLCVVLLGAR